MQKNTHKKISFDENYPKLHNQTVAKLLLTVTNVSGQLLKRGTLKYVTEFDTLRSDGRHYHIDEKKEYMILLFLGNKRILFTSIRAQNNENTEKYCNSVGECFSISIGGKCGQN